MKEADSVVRCRLARASSRLTAGLGTLIAGHSEGDEGHRDLYISGYDSLKFSNIVSLLNLVRGKDSISVWVPVFKLVSGCVD